MCGWFGDELDVVGGRASLPASRPYAVGPSPGNGRLGRSLALPAEDAMPLDPTSVAISLLNLGDVEFAAGRLDEARKHNEASLDEWRAAGR